MPDLEPRKSEELVSGLVDKSLDRATSQLIAFSQISSFFVNTAIRSSFLLNGMALFALPPILIAFSGDDKVSLAQNFFTSATWFILGILLAAGCCLIAYLGYQVAIFRTQYQQSLEAVHYNATHDVKGYFKNHDHFRRVEARNLLIEKQATNTIFWTAAIGILFVGLSFFSFVKGCFSAGLVLLAM